LKAFLQTFQILSDPEIDGFVALASPRSLRKGEFFMQEGKTCTEVAFIQSGLLRSFRTLENGEESTYCLSFPNTFMTAYSAFITGEPGMENIQAIQPTELLIVRKSDVDVFAKKHINGLHLLKYIAEQQYLALEKRIFLYQQQPAKERYEEITAEYPEYAAQIPLQYLASYLGITPRHLSRLRKETLSAAT
jgi:CRP-like cAMP-binding protein